MILITSILAGIFVGAALLMLYLGLKDKKSATCTDDSCECKNTSDMDGVEFGDDIKEEPKPKPKPRRKPKKKPSNPKSEEL